MNRRHKQLMIALLVSALVVVVLMSLTHLLREISFVQVKQSFAAISQLQLALALMFTVLSYLSMSLYDFQALKVIAKPLRWRTAATATSISYAMSNTLGFSAFTGGAARYRIYSANSLDASDVARVIAIAMASFWAAVTLSSGVALLEQQSGLKLGSLSISHVLCLIIGFSLVLLILLLLVLIAKNHGQV